MIKPDRAIVRIVDPFSADNRILWDHIVPTTTYLEQLGRDPHFFSTHKVPLITRESPDPNTASHYIVIPPWEPRPDQERLANWELTMLNIYGNVILGNINIPILERNYHYLTEDISNAAKLRVIHELELLWQNIHQL